MVCRFCIILDTGQYKAEKDEWVILKYENYRIMFDNNLTPESNINNYSQNDSLIQTSYNEVAISFSNLLLQDASLQYKFSKNGNNFFKIGLKNLNLNYTANYPDRPNASFTNHFEFSTNIIFGLAKRKHINKKVITN